MSRQSAQSSHTGKGPDYTSFHQIFSKIRVHGNRYEVFRDFITMAAISLHNGIKMDPKREAEYMSIVGRYSSEEAFAFSHLLGALIKMYDESPRDILGELFMSLNLGNEHTGQFFTPSALSEVIANLCHADHMRDKIDQQGFVTVYEPACGAGGMVLAMAKVIITAGKNPLYSMWAYCQDVDRNVALMCYLQLALWNIPGVVIVGDTLANEVKETWYTPAHWLGCWNHRLKRRDAEEAAIEFLTQEPENPVAKQAEDKTVPKSSLTPPTQQTTPPAALAAKTFLNQMSFDFGGYAASVKFGWEVVHVLHGLFLYKTPPNQILSAN